MANRQSLKELQVRLAERLSAAKAEGNSASWLAVEAGEGRFLVPLVQSGEIFAWANLQAVPYTKEWYAGVVSLRGGLQGVIDLAALACCLSPEGTARGLDRVTSETRLLSLHSALGVNAVLWIDRLQGLRNLSMFVSAAERSAGSPEWFARRLTGRDGRDWQELNLQALVNDPGFLAVAAEQR